MPRRTVSAAELSKRFGVFHDLAQRGPVYVTKHGRSSVVLIAADEYERLIAADRRAVHVSDLPRRWIEAIEQADVPADADYDAPDFADDAH